MPRLASILLAALVAAPALAQGSPYPPSGNGGYDQPPPGNGPTPAQGYGGPGDGGGGGGMSRPLTRDRALAAVDRGFAQMDTNGDGAVTRAEYDAFRQARRAEMMARRQGGDMGDGGTGAAPAGHGQGGGRGGHVGPLLNNPAWFDMADANGDGRVTLAEAQRGAAAMFDRMDLNHDGTIDPDERHQAMRALRGGQGGASAPPQ